MASEWKTVPNNKKKGNKTPTPTLTPSLLFQNTNSLNTNSLNTNSLNTNSLNTSSLNKSLTTSTLTSTSSVNVTSGKAIIKYTKEQIYVFKQINKDQQVTYELSIKFDKINEMFKTSTQYLESKKKINYNQCNHNKWELKNEEDNSIINLVCGGLNKITDHNALEIIKEIEVLEIIIHDDLEKLTEKIIHKCISEQQFVGLYVRVVKHVMTNCNWIVDDSNMIPITFRRIFLNQLEMRFCNLINDVKNMKYEDNESELIVIHSKSRKGLLNLICELYINKIIGNQLIRYIFKNLETAYEETKIEQYLEYWLMLLKAVMNNWLVSEKIYLDEQVQYITEKSGLSSKVRFIIQDQLELLKSKNYKSDEKHTLNENNNIEENEVEQPEENYDLLILSSSEYDSLDKWFNSLGKDIEPSKLLLDLLQITLSDKKQFELVKNVLKYLLNHNHTTKELVAEKIRYIKNENDLSEYKYYSKHLAELLLI